MRRLFLPLHEGATASVSIEGERFHYLIHVLRAQAGQSLEVFDGRGRSFQAHITAIDNARATLTLGAEHHAPPARQITLIQALPKGDKLEWVLQKATELGVTALCPVSSSRSVVKLSDERARGRASRWQKILEEAARQCGRSDVPKLWPLLSFDEALRTLARGGVSLVLDEEERALPLSQANGALDFERPLALFVGPEGGLERDEVQAVVSAGGQAVALGRLILRSETAGIAALAVLRHLEGQLG